MTSDAIRIQEQLDRLAAMFGEAAVTEACRRYSGADLSTADITSHCDWARKHISMAFGEINCLPHGTNYDAAPLIEAQGGLATARRALDAWQEDHDPLFSKPGRNDD